MGLAQQERDGFARRLRDALGPAGHKDLGPTPLSRLFNAKSTHTVSSHAMRKWLMAEAIPRQYHIETFATWLACDAAWLRYGVRRHKVTQRSAADSEALELLRDLSLLHPDAKQLVYGLVVILKAT